VKFSEQAPIDPLRLAGFVRRSKGAQFSPGGLLRFPLRDPAPERLFAHLREVFTELATGN
jgi:transcription-repair coupling factor (superfamily II helicase)